MSDVKIEGVRYCDICCCRRDLSEVYPTDRLKAQPKKEENDLAGFPMKQRKENIISVSLSAF